MARHSLTLGVALAAVVASGCVLSTAPVTNNTIVNAETNAQVQANTQVDQRQGQFGEGSGQQQAGQANQGQAQPPVATPSPSTPVDSTSPTPVPVETDTLPVFTTVKTFEDNAIVSVLNFRTIAVAEGTTLYLTNDSGGSWQKFEGISTSPIYTLQWYSESEGLLGTTNGVMLKVAIQSGQPTVDVLDTGFSSGIVDVAFSSEDEGFALSQLGELNKTNNGGETWDEPVQLEGTEISRRELVRDREGRLFGYIILNRFYRYQSGLFVPWETEGMSINGLSFGDGLTFAQIQRIDRAVGDGSWRYTTDFQQFTDIGRDLRTPTTILRNTWLTCIAHISGEKVLAVMFGGFSGTDSIILSKDLGRTWTEPKKSPFRAHAEWVKAFSDTQFWVWDGTTLYRAGY